MVLKSAPTCRSVRIFIFKFRTSYKTQGLLDIDCSGSLLVLSFQVGLVFSLFSVAKTKGPRRAWSFFLLYFYFTKRRKTELHGLRNLSLPSTFELTQLRAPRRDRALVVHMTFALTLGCIRHIDENGRIDRTTIQEKWLELPCLHSVVC